MPKKGFVFGQIETEHSLDQGDPLLNCAKVDVIIIGLKRLSMLLLIQNVTGAFRIKGKSSTWRPSPGIVQA